MFFRPSAPPPPSTTPLPLRIFLAKFVDGSLLWHSVTPGLPFLLVFARYVFPVLLSLPLLATAARSFFPSCCRCHCRCHCSFLLLAPFSGLLSLTVAATARFCCSLPFSVLLSLPLSLPLLASAARCFCFILVGFPCLARCCRCRCRPSDATPWEVLSKVRDGQRPTIQPPDTPMFHILSPLMARCWAQDTAQRPTFTEVVGILQGHLNVYEESSLYDRLAMSVR